MALEVLLKVEHIFYSPKEFALFKRDEKHAPIIKDISFELNRGEVLGIVGESGSGKTTLLKVIGGMLKHEKGEITFSQSGRNNRSNPVQILFQNSNELINPVRRIGEILNECFRDKEKLNEIRALLDIKESLFEKIGYQLSGGERQRVGLARILSGEPELLLLDEPFSAQDPESQESFLELFKKIKNELDITIICVSHDIKLLRQFADNMIVLFGGEIMEMGNAENIFNLHRHPYTNFITEAFNYKLNRADFTGSPEPANGNKGCAYFSRCGKRSEKCLEYVEVVNTADLKTYCNYPL